MTTTPNQPNETHQDVHRPPFTRGGQARPNPAGDRGPWQPPADGTTVAELRRIRERLRED